MNTYIAHANNSNLQSGLFYSCSDGFKKDNDFNAVSEFNFLKDKDTLIYLIPSYLVSSYTFENNKKISSQNNVANFISEIDSNLVNDVSDNEFFLFEKNAYVIDKQKYKELNYALNFLKCNIILLPDYFICHQSGKDRITEFNDKFLFSFSNGTGNSIDRENIDTYLSVIQRSNPNFNPSISVKEDESTYTLKNYNARHNADLEHFSKNEIENLPNLFKLDFSFKNFIHRLDINKFDLYLCSFLIISIFSFPFLVINQNERNAKVYEEETLKIFKQIDKNTMNIVSPKKQIDELVKQIPNSMKTADLNLDKFANLGFLVNIGEKFIENVEIDYRTNTSILIINGMPEMQFSIIKELAESFDVNVVEQDVEIVDKSASGQITISFRNG